MKMSAIAGEVAISSNFQYHFFLFTHNSCQRCNLKFYKCNIWRDALGISSDSPVIDFYFERPVVAFPLCLASSVEFNIGVNGREKESSKQQKQSCVTLVHSTAAFTREM